MTGLHVNGRRRDGFASREARAERRDHATLWPPMMRATRWNSGVRKHPWARVLPVVGALVLGAWPARAAVIYQLSPSTSVGATSNATVTSTSNPSIVSSLSLVARLRAETPRVKTSLGYRIGFTHFFDPGVNDTLSHEATGTAAFELTRDLSLSFNGMATISRFSNVGTTPIEGQAALPNADLYVASSLGEMLTYAATQRLRFSQGFRVDRLDYLTSTLQVGAGGQPSSSLGGDLRADYGWTRDTVSLTARGGYLIASGGLDAAGMPLMTAGSAYAEGLAGWRREFSLAWWAEIDGGAAAMRSPSGRTTWIPAAIGTLEYRYVPWYATLTVQHGPTVNMFLGTVSVNDGASVHLTLPLDRADMVIVSGFGTYSRGRPADPADVNAAIYSYNQLSVGSVLSVRFRSLPMFGSVMYTLIDQHGTSPTGPPLDILRHTLMVSLTGAFQWGPGTPPLVSGAFTAM